MKRLFILLICCSSWLFAWAQSSNFQPLTPSAQSTLLNQISSAVTSLQCQFVQEKHASMLADIVRSKGTLSFVAPNQLRWQYTSPNTFTFLYLNGRVLSLDANGKPIKQSNRMAQEMSQLIVGIISGKSLNNQQQFNVTCYENNKQYKITLIPLQSRLKSIFHSIELWLDRSTLIATTIQLNEVGGDMTQIQFLKPQINSSLPNSLFQIN